MKIILKLIPLLLVCLFAVGCGKKVESIPPVESVTVTEPIITTTTTPPVTTTTVTVPPVPATTPPPTTTKAAVTKYTGSTETESTLATVSTAEKPLDPDYEKVNLSADKATYTLDDEVILTLSNSSEKELFRVNFPYLAIFIDGEWVSASSLNLLEQQTTEFAKPSPEPSNHAIISDSPDVSRYNLRSEYGELPTGKYRYSCLVAFGGDNSRSVYVEFEIVE